MNTITQVSPWTGSTSAPSSPALGWWTGASSVLATSDSARSRMLRNLRQPLYVIAREEGLGFTQEDGETSGISWGGQNNRLQGTPIIGYAPAISLSQLGDPAFCADHKIKFAYMTGAMANGIASVELVEAVAKAGLLGSFGAAGLRLAQISQAIDRLEESLSELPPPPFCMNLIHTPHEPAHEMAVVELYLRRGIKLVEAAAYLDLTLPAVRYRVQGIYRDGEGRIIAPQRIIAKISRQEVATKWFSPPPAALLAQLVAAGTITAEQAELAKQIPMAQDLTAEADSAGHTDNRPALTLLPTMLALRDRLQQQFGYADQLRVGLGGGISTPASAAAAFAMGAAYIVTGSINQACTESGTCDHVRQMLAQTQQADVTMAPAADMFEMGVKLQVIKRGTMFPMRAAKLYELYRANNSLEEISAAERQNLEKTIFHDTLENIWLKTRQFFQEIDPTQIDRAQKDGKHKMALVFRWYLGLASRWANVGEPTRQMDYQIWCGPAMGAFNEWTKGTFMESPGNRHAAEVGMNLLYGAGVALRLNLLRSQGVRLTAELTQLTPLALGDFEDQLL